MSHGGRRFSTATTASTASSRDKDIPPLPVIGDAWKDSASMSSGTMTPPRLMPGPRPQARPASMRRAVTSATYANSIVESLAEEDDDEVNNWSIMNTLQTTESNHTLRLPG